MVGSATARRRPAPCALGGVGDRGQPWRIDRAAQNLGRLDVGCGGVRHGGVLHCARGSGPRFDTACD